MQKSKPNLPVELRSINNLMGVYYIIHGLVLWLGGGAMAYMAWTTPELNWLLKGAGIAAGVFLSGMGMFFLALLGHEGFHGNMNRQRDVSMLMGIIASCVAPGFVSTGYNVMHWQHHKATNTPEDPDYLLYRDNKTLLSRLMNGPRMTATVCLKHAFMLITAPQRVDRTFPFQAGKARGYALFNVALAIAVLIGYGVLFNILSLPAFVCFVVLPVVSSQSYWALAPYIEHAGTGVGEGKDTRTVTSNVLKVLLVGYNFHLCHHLYPRIQLHKLPAVYRYLESSGYLPKEAVVEPSALSAFRIGAFSALKF